MRWTRGSPSYNRLPAAKIRQRQGRSGPAQGLLHRIVQGLPAALGSIPQGDRVVLLVSLVLLQIALGVGQIDPPAHMV